jgi:hypothetical protein
LKSAYLGMADISIFQRTRNGSLAVSDARCLFMEKILNLLMRAILGTIAMYFINSALNRLGVPLGVGINAATVLTSGILGFPGLLALYGIGIYKIL